MRYILQWTTGKKASALHRAFEKLQITQQAQQADSQGAAEKGAQQPHKQKTEKDREKAGEESERDKVGEAASKRLADLQSRGKPKKEKNEQLGEAQQIKINKSRVSVMSYLCYLVCECLCASVLLVYFEVRGPWAVV